LARIQDAFAGLNGASIGVRRRAGAQLIPRNSLLDAADQAGSIKPLYYQ
jgi:hypothetical protein